MRKQENQEKHINFINIKNEHKNNDIPLLTYSNGKNFKYNTHCR